ncbi:hypothetical protein DITRI_Ditri18aG0082900 [Diplodiscus trichospermus]
MEKLLRPYDKEYMKMAMLKHEETFKEQVYELHRIYQIQKTLMKSIGSSRCNGSFSLKDNHHGTMHQNSRMTLDLERPADQEFNIAESSDHEQGNRMFEVIDESEIELTLGPTNYMRPRKKHGTPPLTSDSGPSFSSSSTESSHMNRTCSSSTKQKTNTTDEFSGGRELELLQVPDMTLGYQNRRKNNVDLEEQLSQERLKHPPWLFQVLSMNMT